MGKGRGSGGGSGRESPCPQSPSGNAEQRQLKIANRPSGDAHKTENRQPLEPVSPAGARPYREPTVNPGKTRPYWSVVNPAEAWALPSATSEPCQA